MTGRPPTDARHPEPDGRFHESIVAVAGELSGLRAKLRRWLAGQRIDGDDANDIMIAIGEATANAVEHAYRGVPTGRIDVDISCSDDVVTIEVRDHGRWRVVPAPGDRGRGIPLMRAVSAFEIRPTTAGTTVTMRRNVTRG